MSWGFHTRSDPIGLAVAVPRNATLVRMLLVPANPMGERPQAARLTWMVYIDILNKLVKYHD